MAFQWQLAKRPWKGAEKGFSGDRSEENLPPSRLYSHYSGRFRAFLDEISGFGGGTKGALGTFSAACQKGRFVWPSAKDGKIALTPARSAMLLEG